MPGIDFFQSHFAPKKNLVHLNNAGLSPISTRAEAVVLHWVRRYREEGMFCNDDYLEALEEARQTLAEFLDADREQLAFFSCTSAALSQVAFHIGLQAGEEVLMWDQEYGSHLYPWQAACQEAGASLHLLASEHWQTPTEKMLQAIGPRTKVLAVSWIQYQSGALSNLEALAQKAQQLGIHLVVDGIQGIGLLPFSFRKLGISALAGGSHKWMCAPVGAAYLCLRPDLAKTMKARSIGAGTYGSCDDPTDLACIPKQQALRLESGSRAILEILALAASAELLRETGQAEILKSSLQLAQQLHQGLESLGYQCLSANGKKLLTPFVNVQPTEKSPYSSLDALQDALKQQRISYARRGPGIRLTPHAHNQASEIDYVLQSLARG